MLSESVARNRCDAILLSGGLDSSILAGMLRPSYAVTCSYGSDSADSQYAGEIAGKFCGRLAKVAITPESMLDLVGQIVQVFKTFDPIEIRNSAVALAGITRAKQDGHRAVMTGDGGDELFAGYNYLARYYSDPDKLDFEVRRLWKVMHFSSQRIGEHLGVRIMTPFLDPDFMRYSQSLPMSDRVGEQGGRLWGKYILRACYEDLVGSRVAWREKMAQEQGAGTDEFEDYIGEMIDDLTFANRSEVARREGVLLRSKEHLHYYAVYRSHFPAPKDEPCDSRCPSCRGCMALDARFCRTCGAYPVVPSA